MDTLVGHYYRLVLSGKGIGQDQGALLIGPLSTYYASDVVSLGTPDQDHAVAVLRWKGPSKPVSPGDVVPLEVPGSPLTILTGTKSATLVAVDDVPEPPNVGRVSTQVWQMVSAVALVLATVWLVGRVPDRVRKGSRR